MGDGVCVFDVVVDVYATVAAPVSAVGGIFRMDFGAEAHADLGGAFPRAGWWS